MEGMSLREKEEKLTALLKTPEFFQKVREKVIKSKEGKCNSLSL